MTALEPKECTRCRASMSAECEARPVSISSNVYRPENPRPTLGDTVVWWEIEDDYKERGPIAALLCPACVSELSDWLYLARSERAPAPTS